MSEPECPFERAMPRLGALLVCVFLMVANAHSMMLIPMDEAQSAYRKGLEYNPWNEEANQKVKGER